MGWVKDIADVILRRKTPLEYKTWQDVTNRTIQELLRENEECRKESERLKQRITELETNVNHLMKSKGRNMYE